MATQEQISALVAKVAAHPDFTGSVTALIARYIALLGPQFFNYGPAVVSEDDANGTVVSDLAEILGGALPLTWSLIDDAGGRFTIDASTGQITVADAASIVYATATSHDIAVRVTDAKGLTKDGILNIPVTQGAEETPLFTVSLDTNVVDEAWLDDAELGTFTVTEEATAPVSFAITAGNGAGIFALNSSTGVLTLADASQIDPGQVASYPLTVTATDDTAVAVPLDVDIVVAGKVQVVSAGVADFGATSADTLSGTIPIPTGVNRKIIIPLAWEDGAAPLVDNAASTLDGSAVTQPSEDISTVEESGFNLGALWGRYDVPDAVEAGDYTVESVLKAAGVTEAASQGGILGYVALRNARQGPLFQPVTQKIVSTPGVSNTPISYADFETTVNGTAVLCFTATNNHNNTWTPYAAGATAFTQGAGSPGISLYGSQEIRDAAGQLTVSHSVLAGGSYDRAISFLIPVPPVLEPEPTEEAPPPPPPPPPGPVINATSGTLAAVQAAYNQVSQHDTTIIIPAGDYTWTGGLTIPANGWRVHIRGADWSPSSTLYLPTNYSSPSDNSKVDQALSDFQPATRIFLTGSSASTTMFSLDKTGVTLSRLWLRGRGTGTSTAQKDTAIRLTNMSGVVIYWCRFENFRGVGISCSGTAASCLITDNVFWQANYADSGSNASFNYNVNFSTDPENLSYTYGNTAMPYFQRNLVRGGTHAFDLGRAGRGACRDNMLVNGIGSRGKLRIHGYYLSTGSPQYSGGPWEFYRNRYATIGGTNPWTGTTESQTYKLLDAKGFNGIFYANQVVAGSFGGNPMNLTYEATSRSHPDNPTCADLSSGNYPYPNQTTAAYFWENLNLGSPLVADGNMLSPSCAGKIIKISPATVGGASQVFNSAHPTWSDPGEHPLMPADIAA